MTDRIVEIAEGPAELCVRDGRIRIRRPDHEDTFVPLRDLAGLVVAHPRVTSTQAVFTGLAEAGAFYIACDETRLPAAMLVPIRGHCVQAERFRLQAAASLPLQKRLWKQIVRAKVLAQSRLLRDIHGHDYGLSDLARGVRSGDPSNVEARAARRYWPALFTSAFRRDREAADQNRFLNYGYAVVRAAVARAACASGLHPGLGIHHHNRYNPMPLADDLMEPLRPLVDRATVDYIDRAGADAPMDREARAALVGILTRRFRLNGESRALFDILARTAGSLVAVFEGSRRDLLLPEI